MKVRVWFLLGRCFPILVTLHHCGREEEEDEDGPGHGDEVPSLQRNSRGPWSFLQLPLPLLLRGGGATLDILTAPTCLFEK